MKFKIDVGKYHPRNKAESELYAFLLQYDGKYIDQEQLEALKKKILDKPHQINATLDKPILEDFKFNELKSTHDQWIIGNGMRFMINFEK